MIGIILSSRFVATLSGLPPRRQSVTAQAVRPGGTQDLVHASLPVAKWDAIIAIALAFPFHAIRAGVPEMMPEMKARKWG
jgi:hypothetical protein